MSATQRSSRPGLEPGADRHEAQHHRRLDRRLASHYNRQPRGTLCRRRRPRPPVSPTTVRVPRRPARRPRPCGHRRSPDVGLAVARPHGRAGRRPARSPWLRRVLRTSAWRTLPDRRRRGHAGHLGHRPVPPGRRVLRRGRCRRGHADQARPGGVPAARRTRWIPHPRGHAGPRAFIDAENAALAGSDLDAAVEANVAWWVDGPRRETDVVDPTVREQVRQMQRRAFELTDDWDDLEDAELYPPALDRLAEIRVPTLVLVGGLDLDAIHDAARMVTEGIAGARRVDWPDVAHLPSMERPTTSSRCCVTGWLITAVQPDVRCRARACEQVPAVCRAVRGAPHAHHPPTIGCDRHRRAGHGRNPGGGHRIVDVGSTRGGSAPLRATGSYQLPHGSEHVRLNPTTSPPASTTPTGRWRPAPAGPTSSRLLARTTSGSRSLSPIGPVSSAGSPHGWCTTWPPSTGS